MRSSFPPRSSHAEWKTLYRAAILETDKNVIHEKLSEAEAAALARGRELFYGGGSSEETEALEDALYALRAFKSSLEHAEAP